MREAFGLRVGQSLFRFKQRPAFVVHEAEFARSRCQAEVGVVFAQQQAVLGATGEHAIRFARALGHKVIDQHAQIAVAALGNPGFALAQVLHGVDASDQALRRGFFIACRAIDLAGKEQACQRFGLQR